jgi:hypothetical protein
LLFAGRAWECSRYSPRKNLDLRGEPVTIAEKFKDLDSASPEETADLVQVVAELSRGGALDGWELAWSQVAVAPWDWLRRGLFLGLVFSALILWTTLCIEGFWYSGLGILWAFLTLGLVPALGLARHRKQLVDGEVGLRTGGKAILHALPAWVIHGVAVSLLWILQDKGGASTLLGFVGSSLLIFLPLSWAITLGELALMQRGPWQALVRGPTRTVGYLLRLPGRLLRAFRSSTRDRPRLLEALGFSFLGLLSVGVLGTKLAKVVLLYSLSLGPGVGMLLEWVVAWGYFSAICLFLDAGSSLWAVRYLEYQAHVGVLELPPP